MIAASAARLSTKFPASRFAAPAYVTRLHLRPITIAPIVKLHFEIAFRSMNLGAAPFAASA